MSSANKWKLNNFEVLGRSLIYSKNNRGPRTDPWGTPHVFERESDLWPLIHTNKVLYWTDTIETSRRLYLLLHNNSIKIPQPITDWFGNLYQCMISWVLLPKAKSKWVKNVMIFKKTTKALKHGLSKNFTKNREDWYWPIVIFVLARAFLKNWSNFCQFKNLSFLGKMHREKHH